MRGGVWAVLLLMLVACASAPRYRPASGQGWGYSEQSLAADRYQVIFRLRGDGVAEAQRYALRRAAELTMQQGYDWFLIDDQQSQIEHHEALIEQPMPASPTMVRQCSLLHCQTTIIPTAPIIAPADEPGETVVTLLIHLGKGGRPAQSNCHDAREVLVQVPIE